jgi:putative endonuclease
MSLFLPLLSRLASHITRRAIGECGEAAAEAFLRRQGACVLHRNWRSPGDKRLEIDRILHAEGILVFVEVKTVSAVGLNTGREKLDARKRRALAAAIHAYLELQPAHVIWRADLVEVFWHKQRPPECVHHLGIRLPRHRPSKPKRPPVS